MRLRDQEGVDTLLQFNDGYAHVYASSLEETTSIPPSGGAENIELIVVSDSEGDTTPAGNDENDLASPLKKAWCIQSAGDSEPQQKEAVGGDDQMLASVTRSCSNSRPPSGCEQNVVHIIDSDSESDVIPDNNPQPLYYPDPEFSDFDKHKAENCFAVDQFWAVYDELDRMPKYYAHIRKVSGPEFKIKLRWLVPHQKEDQRERAWVKAGLPVGCGIFIHGSIDYIIDQPMFSHQVQCKKGTSGRYILYPRKGETWGIFIDWDICWSSDPKNNREYKYEVVEILSDYVKKVGIRVGYLEKVTGFVSLFRRTKLTVVGSFFIKPKELYKFSHQIPSFKMTGTEGEGVPAGSFELDLCALPLNTVDIWYPGKVKEDSRTAKYEPVENVLSAVPPGTRDQLFLACWLWEI